MWNLRVLFNGWDFNLCHSLGFLQEVCPVWWLLCRFSLTQAAHLTDDLPLFSWKFVSQSHKLLQSLAGTYTRRLAAKCDTWLPRRGIGLLSQQSTSSLVSQIQERDAQMPFRETLNGSNSLLAHFSSPSERLYSPSEPNTVRWAIKILICLPLSCLFFCQSSFKSHILCEAK